MERSSVHILGSNSAVAVYGRYPSGQLLKIGRHHILIDCGEGTQFRLAKYKHKPSKIDVILITHLHGDHVFGLPGLLTSFQLTGRIKPLLILGPEPLKKYLDVTLGGTGHFIDYPIEIKEFSREQITDELTKVLDLHDAKVEYFRLVHRIPCMGYKITEKPKRAKLNKDFVDKYQPDVAMIKQIFAGEDYVQADMRIKNEEILTEPLPPRSYAYCSDTLFHPVLTEILNGCHTIYHEATYLDEMKHHAKERYHSTAKQAAEIAKGAFAQKLILGHFSSKYREIEPFRLEAKQVFQNVELAREGESFDI